MVDSAVRPDDSAGMDQGDHAGLRALFEDLEQQAAGIELAERDAELADRSRGEYAGVTLASRVHASVGQEVALLLTGGQVVQGRLTAAGADWCRVAPTGPGGPWLVRLAAVAVAGGMSPRSVPVEARPVVTRLGFGSALHRLAEESSALVVHLVSREMRRVRVDRVGADFVEVERVPEEGRPVRELVAFEAILAVRTE